MTSEEEEETENRGIGESENRRLRKAKGKRQKLEKPKTMGHVDALPLLRFLASLVKPTRASSSPSVIQCPPVGAAHHR
jgi:hypothetical protein